MTTRTPRMIAFINQKGGVGKTTTAANIGAALAQAGKKVCMIDLDPQAHLTLHLGVDEEKINYTVYDLLIDPARKASETIVHARENLDAILAEVDLAGAEPELADTTGRQLILKAKFHEVAHNYDFVLLDCPPSLGLLTLNALALVNEVIVPMQAHFLALQGVGKLLETVSLVCQSVNPDLRVTGVVICMHESQTTLAKEVLADLETFFEEAREKAVPWRTCRVLQPPVRRNIKLAEAPSFGKTILEYEPSCPGADDYRKLAMQIVAMSEKETTKAPAAVVETQPAPKPKPADVNNRPEKPVVEVVAKPSPQRSVVEPKPAVHTTPAAPPAKTEQSREPLNRLNGTIAAVPAYDASYKSAHHSPAGHHAAIPKL